MKRILPLLLFFLTATAASAQIVNLTEVMSGHQSKITVNVRDSVSREPLAFASVYLIPDKDTVITNFTLTDPEGKATLDEVPFGAYIFNVEMLGYHPRRTRTYLRDENVNMGTILMVVDPHYLDAAVVSDVGNPIIVKKDTLIFNASSFRTNANAMLKDLLLKLPGVEITSNGKVKINGELVDKVTVGGRTFFFDDQAMAINNLPASIVDKISFIDRATVGESATGIKSGDKEKVMDVTLKKEYQKGWFGNVTLRGGTSAGKNDEELREDRNFLYKSNALLAAYNEKDQITVVGNAVNVTDDDMLEIIDNGDGIYSSTTADDYLVTAGQLGVNVNTTRIKDVESSAMLNYRHSGKLFGDRTSRTTFLTDGELLTNSKTSAQENSDRYVGKADFRKMTGKVWFMVTPDLQYRKGSQTSQEESSTSRDGILLNNRSMQASERFTNRKAHLDADVILQDVFGKTGRSLWIATQWNYFREAGDRDEATGALASSVRQPVLSYGKDGTNRLFSVDATWSEPFGEKWILSLMAGYQASNWKDRQDAFQETVRKDALTYQSNLLSVQQRYEGSAQYSFSEDHTLRLGVRAIGIRDIVDNSRLSTKIGEQWHWFLAPVGGYNLYKKNNDLSFEFMNYMSRPNRKWFTPAPDISTPSHVQVGNVYLKSGYTSILQGRFSRENPKKFSSMYLYCHAQLTSSPTAMAQWYDGSGILYSVPVNAARPEFSVNPSIRYTFFLDKKKVWSLSTRVGGEYSTSSSYYSFSEGRGIDIDTFQYAPFMESIWGNADGDLFYSGKSGFSENITRGLYAYGSSSLKFNAERFSTRLSYYCIFQKAWYSLLPAVKRNTLDHTISLSADYTTKHEFEFSSDVSYNTYHGYAAGFGLPEWIWNLEVSKNVGPFNLSIQAFDLLDQTRNMQRTTHSNYEETSYRMVMGRYVLFGVRWNFGKMNAANSSKASTAAMEMSL